MEIRDRYAYPLVIALGLLIIAIAYPFLSGNAPPVKTAHERCMDRTHDDLMCQIVAGLTGQSAVEGGTTKADAERAMNVREMQLQNECRAKLPKGMSVADQLKADERCINWAADRIETDPQLVAKFGAAMLHEIQTEYLAQQKKIADNEAERIAAAKQENRNKKAFDEISNARRRDRCLEDELLKGATPTEAGYKCALRVAD